MVAFTTRLTSIVLLLMAAVPATLSNPIAAPEAEADPSPSTLEPRLWPGVKAYLYSNNCGTTNGVDGYTWPASGVKGCHTYVSGGQRLDMYSLQCSDCLGVIQAVCGGTGYGIVGLYSSSYSCTGSVEWYVITGPPACLSLPGVASFKSFEILRGESGCSKKT